MKINKIYSAILVIGVVLIDSRLFSNEPISEAQRNYDDDMKQIGAQHSLEEEGWDLKYAGKYDEALAKYQAALELDEKQPPHLRGRVIFSVADVLQRQGKYQEALDKLKNNPYRNPKHEYGNDHIAELEALVEYQKTGDPKAVYEYIRGYQEKYRKGIPPSGFGTTYVETILRLYDTIGDQTAGIVLTDECLDFIYKQNPKFEKVNNSEEAARYIKYGDPNGILQKYYLIREGFEKDKAQGTKGNATKAYI